MTFDINNIKVIRDRSSLEKSQILKMVERVNSRNQLKAKMYKWLQLKVSLLIEIEN